MRFGSSLFAVAALVGVANAHFILDYPYNRGFDEVSIRPYRGRFLAEHSRRLTTMVRFRTKSRTYLAVSDSR